MQVLIQRVLEAQVRVSDNVIGEIGPGLLLLLGVEKTDSGTEVEKLVNKVLNYRIFSDKTGQMNESLLDVGGELLVISQFTMAANTKKGLRPSFSSAAAPTEAEALYQLFVDHANKFLRVQTGLFGADMQVSLINEGPVTFLLSG